MTVISRNRAMLAAVLTVFFAAAVICPPADRAYAADMHSCEARGLWTSPEMTYLAQSDHFVYQCAPQHMKYLDMTARTLEKAYPIVTGMLYRSVPGKTRVYIAPDEDTYSAMMDWNPHVSWSTASAQSGSICIAAPRIIPGMLPSVVVHELVHIVVDRYETNPPMYLSEGVASYIAEQSHLDPARIQRDLRNGSVPSLEELEEMGHDGGDIMRLYCYGQAFVTFVAETRGFDSIPLLINQYSLTNTLGTDMASLNSEWMRFLAEKYGSGSGSTTESSWSAISQSGRPVHTQIQALPEPSSDPYAYAPVSATQLRPRAGSGLSVIRPDDAKPYVTGLSAGLPGTATTTGALICMFEQPESGHVHMKQMKFEWFTPDLESPAATGQVVVSIVDGSWEEEAVLVVKGDVMGNGLIGISQVARLGSALSGRQPLRGVYMRAGDFDENGRIDLTDLVREAEMLRVAKPQ